MSERDELAAEVEPWLRECGSCDAALPMACTCPDGDVRTVLLKVWMAFQEAADQRDMFQEKAQNFIRVSGSYDTKLGALLSGLHDLIEKAEQRAVMGIGVSELRAVLGEDAPPYTEQETTK